MTKKKLVVSIIVLDEDLEIQQNILDPKIFKRRSSDAVQDRSFTIHGDNMMRLGKEVYRELKLFFNSRNIKRLNDWD